MESILENNSLFNVSVDEEMKYNLKEISKWANFLGIVGFVSIGLIIVSSIAIVLSLSSRIGQLSTKLC